MGLFSRFKSKPKLYDKTLVLFIPIFSDINPEFARMVDNGGRAKASDVMRLIDYVVEKVYESSGVKLEKEVRLVGNFGG